MSDKLIQELEEGYAQAAKLMERGKTVEALTRARQTASRARASLGDRHPIVAHALSVLAKFEQSAGNLNIAETLLREALEIRRFFAGSKDPALVEPLNNLAQVNLALNRPAIARPLIQETVDICRQQSDEQPAALAIALTNMGRVNMSDEAYAEAIESASSALALLGTPEDSDEKQARVAALQLLGDASIVSGDLDAAERARREALELVSGMVGTGHPERVAAQESLAAVLLEAGEFAESDGLLVSALETVRSVVGERTAEVAIKLCQLAAARSRSGLDADASRLLNAGVGIARTLGPDEASTKALCLRALGEFLILRGWAAEARQAISEAIELARKEARSGIRVLAELLSRDALALAELQQQPEAARQLKAAIALLSGQERTDTEQIASLQELLASVLAGAGDTSGALQAAASRRALLQPPSGSESRPSYLGACEDYAGALLATGQISAALHELKQVIQAWEKIGWEGSSGLLAARARQVEAVLALHCPATGNDERKVGSITPDQVGNASAREHDSSDQAPTPEQGLALLRGTLRDAIAQTRRDMLISVSPFTPIAAASTSMLLSGLVEFAVTHPEHAGSAAEMLLVGGPILRSEAVDARGMLSLSRSPELRARVHSLTRSLWSLHAAASEDVSIATQAQRLQLATQARTARRTWESIVEATPVLAAQHRAWESPLSAFAAALPENGALLVFMGWTRGDWNQATGPVPSPPEDLRLAAVVLTPEGRTNARVVDLGPASAIEAMVRAWHATGHAEAGLKLWDAIRCGLDVRELRSLAIVPDGCLAGLSFESLPVSGSTGGGNRAMLLMDQVRVRLMTSPHGLLAMPAASEPSASPVLMGRSEVDAVDAAVFRDSAEQTPTFRSPPSGRLAGRLDRVLKRLRLRSSTPIIPTNQVTLEPAAREAPSASAALLKDRNQLGREASREGASEQEGVPASAIKVLAPRGASLVVGKAASGRALADRRGASWVHYAGAWGVLPDVPDGGEWWRWTARTSLWRERSTPHDETPAIRAALYLHGGTPRAGREDEWLGIPTPRELSRLDLLAAGCFVFATLPRTPRGDSSGEKARVGHAASAHASSGPASSSTGPSSTGPSSTGEARLALAHGLILAGARCVVMPSERASASDYARAIDRFYVHVASGMRAGDAAHRAKLDLREANDPAWSSLVAFEQG
ncbi:MAG: tetratricopeptide repeat protein [Planctomycetota bacterium]|nr:tetratricopeptide repeat protein [Planctomycetota bacterium]